MTDYSTDMTKWTLAGGGDIVNVTAKMNADGSVTLSYALDENSTQTDLNGLLLILETMVGQYPASAPKRIT